MEAKYIVVDIGCIECGESSAIVGVFSDKALAEAAIADCERLDWRDGQHSYEMFDVPELNKVSMPND